MGTEQALKPDKAGGFRQLHLLVQLFLETVDELINLGSGHRVAESLIVAGQGIEKKNVRVMAMTLNTSPAIALALKAFLGLISAFLAMRASRMPMTPQTRPVGMAVWL